MHRVLGAVDEEGGMALQRVGDDIVLRAHPAQVEVEGRVVPPVLHRAHLRRQPGCRRCPWITGRRGMRLLDEGSVGLDIIPSGQARHQR